MIFLIKAAENALKTINASDIATVRRLGRPPHLIQRIMDCVLILNQAKLNLISMDPERPCPKPSWNESLRVYFFLNLFSKISY